MTYPRSPRRYQRALALEPRILLDAAAVATAEAVVAATDTKPGVTASGKTATISIDDNSATQSVDLFEGVTVTSDSSGNNLSTLVITVNSSGSDQALVIDGTSIALTTTTDGTLTTKGNDYGYSVSVSGNITTITISLDASEANTASDVATLIDNITYTADKTVESSTVTVTLTSLSDYNDSDGTSDTTDISAISTTITVTSDINVAPVLSSDSALEAAESFSADDLGSTTEVTYSSDGSHAYVAGDGAISVYSVDAQGRLTLEQTYTVEGLGTVTHLVTSADGTSVYAIDSSNLYVLSVNADGTLASATTVEIGGATTGGLAISEDGAYVYVGSQWNGIYTYSRDSSTGELTLIGYTGGSADRSGVITTVGDYVYVMYIGSPYTLTVYQQNDDGTLTEVDRYTTSTSGYSTVDFTLAVSSDGQYIYVGDPSSGTVTLYRFTNGSLDKMDTTSLTDVSSIALSSDGTLLYAATSTGTLNTYSIASDGTLTLVSSTTTSSGATDIAVSSDGLSILVAGGSLVRYTSAQTLDLGQSLTFADGLTLSDSNYDTLNSGDGDYDGATITVSASVTTGTYGFADANGLTLADGKISLDGTVIATFTSSGGTLTVTFTDTTTTAVANQVLQQLTYTHSTATAGSFVELTVSSSDSALTSNSVTLTLRVNSAPTVNTDASTGYTLTAATSETAYSYTLYSGLFSDADGDALTWSVTGLPDGYTFDATTRTISGSTTETGTFTVTVTVTDASGSSASLVLELSVTQIANRSPEASDSASATLTSATEGTAYSVTLDTSLIVDADSVYGDTLTWSVSDLPEGLVFDATTLVISGTASTLGTYTVTVTATDSSGASTSREVTLRVISQAEADNSSPVLSAADSAVVYTADGTLSGYSYYVGGLSLSEDGTVLTVLGSTSTNFGGTAYISIYSRDTTTGVLTLITTFTQGTTDDGNASNGVEINGISASTAVVTSDDGSSIYVAGSDSSGNYVIVTLTRDSNGDYTVSGTDVLAAKAVKLELSSDGNVLYAMGASALYTYTVSDDGDLTAGSSFTSNFTSATSIAISSDNTVYVLSSTGTVTVYTTSSSDVVSYAGKLSLSGTALTWTDSSGTATSAGSVSSSSELSGNFQSIAVTDDGYVYVATGTNNRVTVLHYLSDSNTLSYVATYNPYASLSAGSPWAVAVSADGTTLYVGANNGTLGVYSIASDGTLTLVKTVAVGRPITTLEVSEDGVSIYSGARYYNTSVSRTTLGNTVSLAYTEGGTVTPAASISLSDADYDAMADGEGNYNGATLTITRSGTANSTDTYGFTAGNDLTLSDGVIYLDGTAIASFTSSDGTLTISFTADVTTAVANQVLQQVTYTNTSTNPGISITLQISLSDAYTSTTANVQLAVTTVNDAPTLSTSADSVTYTSGGNAVKLFDDSSVDTVEDGQLISSLTLTVSGLTDGSDETLVVGGTSIALVSGTTTGQISVTNDDGSTSTYSYTVTVTLTDGVASVTLSSSAGLSTAAVNALLDSLAYANTSDTPTTGERSVTLSSLTDNGGTSNGGTDTTALAITSTVAVSLSNTAPTLSASGATTSYVENGAAVTLFSDVTLSTGENGQAISSLTLTVSGLSDGSSETLTIDGTEVALVAGSGTTASGYAYTVSVENGTATVVISSSDGIAADDASSLITGLSYANSSDDPTAGTRTVTLTAVQDDGGTANSGADTTALAISASVSVVAVNDAPVVDATALEVSYATSGTSAALFSDVTVSAVESSQLISSLTFNVSGVLDGSFETLTIDGTSIALVAGSGTTSSGYSYSVTVSGDSVVVTLSSSAGISGDSAASLIEQARYTNLSNTQSAGVRSISLSVQDNGGTADGGADSTTLTASASVEVIDNSSPVLSAGADYNDLSVADSLASISGLSDIASSTLSSAGDYLYVTSSDGTVAILSRNTSSGELTLLSTVDSGLTSAAQLTLSGDGSTLYLLSGDGNSVAVFSRDSTDGSLVLTQTLTTANATELAVASDGSALYVIDGTYSGLRVYTLDADSGQYVLTQSISASTSSEPYLFNAVEITVVGDYVYVLTDPAADSVANTLIVYQRNSDGTLTAVAYLRDGSDVDLSSPVDITVSSDGSTVYVANADSIAVFSFDADSATLTYQGEVSGLSDVSAVALSSDDGTLYVTSSDGSISRYKVDGSTLTLLQTLDGDSLAGATEVLTAANGTVIVTGSGGVTSLTDSLGSSVPVSYTEHSTVVLAGMLTLSDSDYDALADGAGNYNGATITLVRADGASSDDSFSIASDSGLTLTDGTLYLDGSAIATVSSSDGSLTLTFTADVTTAVANQVLASISYTNTSGDPGSSVSLTLSVSDAYGASASTTFVLAITQVNDAPTLTGTAASTQYVEGSSAVSLFTGTTVSTVEAGQSITGVTLSVSGLSDGASETLTVDGTTISLVEGTGTTSNGYSYSVTLSDGTATVVITSSAGISAEATASLVDSLGYANASSDPTSGARTVTLTSLSDDGGTADGGTDTTSLSLSATVSVVAVNDAPTLTASSTATFTEGDSATGLFSDTAVSTVEAGQSISGLVLSVTGVSDGASESLNVDGTTIALVAGSGTTSSGYSYTVTLSNGTATLVISSAAGMSTAATASLVDGISYSNSSSNPTAGARNVTLASVQDSGGTADGGIDRTTLGITSTVTVVPVNDAPSVSTQPSPVVLVGNDPFRQAGEQPLSGRFTLEGEAGFATSPSPFEGGAAPHDIAALTATHSSAASNAGHTNSIVASSRLTVTEQVLQVDMPGREVAEASVGSFSVTGNTLVAQVDATPRTLSLPAQLPDGSTPLRLSQANGMPLPNWVRFDPRTGELQVDGARLLRHGTLRLNVISRDGEGHEHRTTLEVRSSAAPVSRAEPAPSAEAASTDTDTAPPSVPEQLRQAAPSALLSDARALLESLAGLDHLPHADTRHIASTPSRTA